MDAAGQIVGSVLQAQNGKLLVVLQVTDTDPVHLRLNDYNQAPLILLTADPS